MSSYSQASSGLKMMFLAEIAAIVCTIIAIIPFIGIIGAIGVVICGAASIYGLFMVTKDIENAKKAFYCQIASVVISLLNAFINSSLLDAAGSVLDLLVLYFLIDALTGPLNSVGRADVAAFGTKIWNINLVCTILGVVLSILAVIPLISILAGIAAFFVAIASIVAAVMFILYLKKSSEALA